MEDPVDLKWRRDLDMYNYYVESNQHEMAKIFAKEVHLNPKKGRVLGFHKLRTIQPSNAKITCCQYSPKGNLLLSGGREKKVLMWDLDKLELTKMAEKHSHVISDIRFKPDLDSTVFATSSFDRTVLLWDATNPSKYISKLEGHGGQVMSLDFSERVPNVFCSSDSNDEIRMWTLAYSRPLLFRTFKGGNRQIRFQPQTGNLLACASGTTINFLDYDSCQFVNKFEGHAKKEINSICWDMYGNYVASVSDDTARLWCLRTGKCVKEYSSASDGDIYECCTCHPLLPGIVVIGCNRTILLWHTKINRMAEVGSTRKAMVSSVTHSPYSEMLACSHDQYVTLWR